MPGSVAAQSHSEQIANIKERKKKRKKERKKDIYI
jgi:hypothetical protein